MINTRGEWERLSYSYELPWVLNKWGRSKNDRRGRDFGTYRVLRDKMANSWGIPWMTRKWSLHAADTAYRAVGRS
jgi:hypothetical protein